ncbi:MAG: hypothetical protein DMG41_27525 [Acidobacteria bacterium]|nr:MAG: hypothetical protein DMG42_30940 [Acidobacteriota bacterium]PYT84465.1 MAG: hypothetical protein DMG41_27525 [Acidobacteriota bacterium]
MTVMEGAPRRKPGFPTKTLPRLPLGTSQTRISANFREQHLLKFQGASLNLPAFNILVRLESLRHGQLKTKGSW